MLHLAFGREVALWHQIEGGLVFFKNAEFEGVVDSWRESMFNRQFGDPSISNILQLVVNIVQVHGK